MKQFGLIGYPLTHSFSKKYFTEKFKVLGIQKDHSYELFEIENIDDFPLLFEQNESLVGVNVTIPHKLAVFPYLTKLDTSATKVGAVNVIKKTSEGLVGFNSDFYGFKRSLLEFTSNTPPSKAMILGYGGAAKAVKAVLEELEIETLIVGRKATQGKISYDESSKYIASHHLIINCSPLGTYPNIDSCPSIAYEKLNSNHFLFDLVYNPELTLFLQKGEKQGAQIKNGYDMLVYQAEKSWEIWNN